MPKLWPLFALLLPWLLTGCGGGQNEIFTELEQRAELRVVTRNSPTTYFFDGDLPSGFEYDLLTAFAEAEGYQLSIEVAFTLDDLLNKLTEGNVHIAAAGLTLTPERQRRFLVANVAERA